MYLKFVFEMSLTDFISLVIYIYIYMDQACMLSKELMLSGSNLHFPRMCNPLACETQTS
jgi:hypothetical protein